MFESERGYAHAHRRERTSGSERERDREKEGRAGRRLSRSVYENNENEFRGCCVSEYLAKPHPGLM